MQIGMIGLGRMGGNMALRLMRGGHQVAAYDPNAQAVQSVARDGAEAAATLADLVSKLSPPRVVWVMVPAGQPTEDTLVELGNLLSPDDVVIEGGNSYYKDSVRRAQALAAKGIGFLDCGTSGGVWGLEEGYSLMVGGDPEVFVNLIPMFETLSPGQKHGLGLVGPAGAGHYVKMVHNGIEYGLLQAYAEG
ncbi:MAG: NADP-dependent phosphogluconate dehydrogenase, partial [Chloroflexi bacterium]|nr:NADP-dependent phosphogluconate dehydrogenase [Chloroflexota bacterium]